MRKLNLYEIEVEIVRGNKKGRAYFHVAARNMKNGFQKARNALPTLGYGWKLTGNYRMQGRVFL